MMPPSANSMIPLMEASGQTDEERRGLRQKQRALQNVILTQAEAMENPCDQVFGKVREENNDLFQKVFFVREAVLDGENMDMISERAAKQVEGLVQVARYDAMRFTLKLRQKCTRGSYFDWNALGVEVGTCFNAVPSRIQFLGGPLHADFEPKIRQARAQRKKQDSEDEEEEERPEEVKNQEKNADQLSAVERNMKTLNNVLKKRSKEAANKHMQEISELPDEEQGAARKKLKGSRGFEVDAIQYMFNPKSFTQTVENIFHFSFLVKKGTANICVRPDGPKVASIKESAETAPPTRQAIVSINMQDWRELCRAYNVEQSDIPHRTGSKQVNHFKKSPGAP